MTITANQLLQLFGKVQKLGYTYDVSEDEKGGYNIVIRYWDKKKTTLNLYVNNTSNRWNDEFNYDYDEFNEVMEDLDRELNAKVIDKERQERFKMYQKLQKEFQSN